jgi:hypothetical protein
VLRPKSSNTYLQKIEMGKSPRGWTDLSFLDTETYRPQDQKSYGIYEAHISIVICGSENTRWVAYAFVDRYCNTEELENELSSEGLHVDPIAGGEELDSDLPVWNPREYFLIIVELRLGQVLREWQNVVRRVERSIKKYASRPFLHFLHLHTRMADKSSREVNIRLP